MAGYEAWWAPVFMLGVGCFAGTLYLLFVRLKNAVLPSARNSMLAATVLSPIFAIVFFGLTYMDYDSLRNDYNKGHYREVSGAITDFIDSGPDMQPGTEKFSIAGVPFSYSRYSVAPGFRKTHAEGGPLRNGLSVKIRYIGQTIVRLEICET
jgi:hypothetical protein